MRVKDMPPQVQELLKKIKKAKLEHAELKALSESKPLNYQIETTYKIAGNEQSITLELSAQTDRGACKESEKFLKEFYLDDDMQFIDAKVLQRGKQRFTTNDIFFYWRQI